MTEPRLPVAVNVLLEQHDVSIEKYITDIVYYIILIIPLTFPGHVLAAESFLFHFQAIDKI